MINSQIYIQCCRNLIDILQKQHSIFSNVNLGDKSILNLLNETERHLTSPLFRVLIVGQIASGKSTFLNALIGNKVLPPKDTTSVSEVYYNGITFVDTPGLSYYICGDDVIMEELHKADAIVYCMNVHQAFGIGDKVAIEKLQAMGSKSIIFVLTYYDMLLHHDEMNGTDDASKTCRYYIEKLSNYTDFGEKGIFFVGSLPTLNAKLNGNDTLLKRSNFLPLEKRLEEILFNEKGRMKLIKAIDSTRKANRKTSNYLENLIILGKQNNQEVIANMVSCEKILHQIRAQTNEICNHSNSVVNHLGETAINIGRNFFMYRITPNLRHWTCEFRPSEEQKISILRPRESTIAFTDGCINHVINRIENEFAELSEKELLHKLIIPHMQLFASQQKEYLAMCDKNLNQCRTLLHLNLGGNAIEDTNQIGYENHYLAGINSLDLFPAYKVIRTSLAEISLVDRIYVVGLPIDPRVGVEGTFKEMLFKRMQTELANIQEEFASYIGKAVTDYFAKCKETIIEQVNFLVLQYDKLFAEAKENTRISGTEIESRIMAYRRLRESNDIVANDLDNLQRIINS